jgi:hypothetical protein
MRRLVFGLVCVVLGGLTACGSSDQSGLRQEDWATIGAYQQQVTSLGTQVAVLFTAIPTAEPATPELPFGQSWTVGVATATEAASYPDYTTQSSSGLTLEARGIFLALRLNVVNATLQPVSQFPWWDLRLRDRQGRTFSPNKAATQSYVIVETHVSESRPDEYQPGLSYDEAVVFDVPKEAADLSLTAGDGSLNVSIPAPTPASPGAGSGLNSEQPRLLGDLKDANDLSHVLRSTPINDEQRVWSINDHDVVDANQRDQAIGAGPADEVRRADLDHTSALNRASEVRFLDEARGPEGCARFQTGQHVVGSRDIAVTGFWMSRCQPDGDEEVSICRRNCSTGGSDEGVLILDVMVRCETADDRRCQGNRRAGTLRHGFGDEVGLRQLR